MLTAVGRSLVDHRAGPAIRIRQNDYEFHLHFQLIDADLPEMMLLFPGRRASRQSNHQYVLRKISGEFEFFNKMFDSLPVIGFIWAQPYVRMAYRSLSF